MRQCAFCPETANLTAEHLWGQWVSEALQLEGVTLTRLELDGRMNTFRHVGLNATAKVVCAGCNNGWMSNLESDTQSIIRDMVANASTTTLQPQQLSVLAALALTKAIIADQMHVTSTSHSILTLAERQRFAKTLSLPPGVQVWLSSLASKNHGLLKSRYSETKGNTSRDVRLESFTYSIGYVVFQVVILRWKKVLFRRQEKPLGVKQSPAWDRFSALAWPNGGNPLDWPTAEPLQREFIESFTERWQHLHWASGELQSPHVR